MAVIVRNFNKRYRINERFIGNIAEKIVRTLKDLSGSGIEIIFLSDASIRPINKRYKGRDRPTDVLSFDLGQIKEILISSDTALENSKRFNSSFENELVLYVIHGILHLSGYDDGTIPEKRRMSSKEESVLKKLCKSENLSKVSMRPWKVSSTF